MKISILLNFLFAKVSMIYITNECFLGGINYPKKKVYCGTSKLPLKILKPLKAHIAQYTNINKIKIKINIS